MPRKVLIRSAILVAAVLAACTPAREQAPPDQAKVAATTNVPGIRLVSHPTTPSSAQATGTRTSAPADTTAQRPPARTLPDMIRGNVVVDGRTLLVSTGRGRSEPVPLFRQAIVLASVRSAVAGLPAQPTAEFRHGLLTLTFKRGTASQIATAVNRALAVPEVDRMRVALP